MTLIPRHYVRRSTRFALAFIATVLLVAGRGSGHLGLLQAQDNPILAENQRPGDIDWNVSGIGDPSIQGFATNMSVNHGAPVQFKVDVSPAGPFHLDIYRIGYYNGAGARRVATIENQAGVKQPGCTSDAATGLVDCGNWTMSAQWNVPSDAVSGVYVAKVVREPTHRLQADGGDLTEGSHIVFVVRDDERKADVLFQTSDTTWQAYNRYGGASTYCAPAGTGVSNAGTPYDSGICPNRATKSSYNRPFDTRVTSPSSWLFSAEYPMIRFLEANGYDTKYWSGVDTDRFGGDPAYGLTSLRKPRIFLSVGHDEYWSGAQRANVENARDSGVSLAFMSGNEMYWKHRWEPSSNRRTLVVYKETMAGAKIDTAIDPDTQLPIWTGTWRDTRFGPHDGGRPENALIGSIWTVNCCTSAISVPASMAGLRLWRNTPVAALTAGSRTLGNETLGYEWGEVLENGVQPAGLVRLSSTTVPDQEKIQGFGTSVAPGTATHSLTLYKTSSGAIVFGASTVQWSWGLDAEHDNGTGNVTDLAMQQATVNLFADMGAQPSSLRVGDGLVSASQSNDSVPPSSTIGSPITGTFESGSPVVISGTANDQHGQIAGVEVSVDGGATWRAAQGRTAWSFNWVPSSPGPVTIRSRAVDDSGNVETPGGGVTVSVVTCIYPCASLWRPTQVPTNLDAGDATLELGVRFKSDVAGFITGVRFYKAPANIGTAANPHTGSLWSASGTRLATAVFTSETASGWQEVSFNPPVAILANTTYVASYFAPFGHYSYDSYYFDNRVVDSPPLHALPGDGNAVTGGNGVFFNGESEFPTSSFHATNYWVDVVFTPILQDAIPPVISSIKATTIDSSKVTVSWVTNEDTKWRLDYGTDPNILSATIPPAGTLSVTNNNFATQHNVTLTGLQSNTTYYYRITAIDRSANQTVALPPTFTVPGPTLRDTASTDFAAGTRTGTYVSETADGEVILSPSIGSEFSGPTLPAGWVAVPWNTMGYSTIENGILVVDGARVATCQIDATTGLCPTETSASTSSAVFTAAHSLNFSARFSGSSFQHAGFGVTFADATEPWAIFSVMPTQTGGVELFARTNLNGGTGGTTSLGTGLLGAFHHYRIDWNVSSVDYYVDGTLVAQHALTVAGPMRPVAASDVDEFGGTVFVDWMRMTPNVTPGAFVSRVFDANAAVDWKSIQWTAQMPAGTALAISVRTGDTPTPPQTPDGTWTPFAPVTSAGPLSLHSRYIQYRADLSSSDPAIAPVLEDIIISTGNAPIAVPDSVAVAKNGSHTFQASGPGSLTFNDSDADVNDTLSVVGVSAPSHGTVVLQADGSVTYTPASLYEGPDAFVYTVSDGLLTASATVSLDVRFGNMPPVAINNFYAAVEDTTLTVPAAAGLLANDSDAEHDVLQAQLVTFPAHGQLALNANGGFSYTPHHNYAGPDSFSYKASDGADSSNNAVVQIEIAQVNDAPFTEPDAFTALLDQPLDVLAPGVLANDHDVEVEDTAPMHAQLVSSVSHGELTLRADGSFSYVPDLSFLGTDSFTYKAVDHLNTASLVEKTVTLTVATKTATATVDAGSTVSTGSGVNPDNPLSSSVMTPSLATVRIAQGVISGSESPALYTFLNQQVNITVTDATGAEVTASAANPIVLTFQIDMSLVPAGQDANTFEFFRNNVLVPDCLGATTIPSNLDPCVSGRATNGDRITLTILTSHASKWNMGLEAASLGGELIATNDGPFVTNFQMPIEKTAPGVLGDDFGPSTISAQLFGTPEGGTVMLAPSGAYTFTPNVGHCGPASFKYKALDGVSESNEATVSLVVNCLPDAVSDTVSVVEDNVTTITVLSNDTDPEGQPVSITAVTQAANGTVSVVAGGMAVSYTPAANFFGSDSFTYSIRDARGDTDTATVNLTVTPVNDAPSFLLNADQTVAEDAGPQVVPGVATAMSAGPANESAQALSFLVANTNNALFSAQPAVDAGGVLTYTPAANAYGSATVTLRIHDDGGVEDGGVDTSGPRTFVITVKPVNDDPVANGDSKTVAEDSGVTEIDVRANDTLGPDAGETLTVSAVTQGAHGTAAVTATGVSYAPNANYNGPDSFTYTIGDGNGGSATGSVTVTVTPVNDNPVANTDSKTVAEDSGVNAIDVRANDTLGPDVGETLTVTAVTQGAHGAATFTATGVGYAPATNYNGPDSFTYTISDGNGGSTTATVNVTVTPVNDNPVATADSATVVEDSGVTNIAVRANDTVGPDTSETLTVTAVTAAAHGTAAVTPTGVSYAPATNYNGPDSFTYTISDGNGGSATAAVNITVTPANDNPVANTDSTTVAEDSGTTAIAVLTNDTLGPDSGETLTVTTVTAAAHGTAAVTATGVSYVPAVNYFGADSFTYTISDGNGGSATATVNVTVTPVNDNPVANADSATVAEDSGVTSIAVRTNDTLGPDTGETLTVTAVTAAAHGTAAVTPTGVSYVPTVNYFGADSFTYTIGDGNGGTASATVTITVTPANDNPVANTDSTTVAEDSGVTNIAVRSNDTLGPDTGETLTVTAVTAASHGTAAVTPTGVSYAPNANYFGADSFTYTIGDGNGGTASATVSVTVTPVNDPPVANADSATVAEDSGVTNIAVRTNDTLGPDTNETLTVTAVTAAAHGTAAVTATGVSYVPAANYFGADSFTYTISDGNGGTASATVTITVTPVNDNPVANADSTTVAEDSGVTNIAVRTNDTLGPDTSEALTVTAVTAAAHGTAAVTPTGVSYVPATNYFGADSFTYTIGDGNGGSASATVTITVTPVNDNPVANTDSATVAEDSGVTNIAVRTNDTLGPDTGETLTVTAVTAATHGTAAVTPTGVSYAPAANYFGPDSFTYTIGDGNGGSATATVNVTVTPANDNPVATADSATVAEDSGVTNIAVRANDTFGPDTGETLTVTAVTAAAHGTAAVTPTGVSYAPAANYFGADSFTYTIGDGNGGSATATVTITVTPVNDNPVANTDSTTVAEDSGVTNIAVRTNDTLGPDTGETLTVTAVTAAAHGTAAVTATGVSYAPAANYFGPDSFTYTIGDGNGGSATATVNITVTPVSDNPVANSDSKTLAEDSGTTAIAVLTNDTLGPDVGETLIVTAVTQGAHGAASFTPTGVSYAPAANYFGADSFTYTIGDGNGGSATATVTVTVTPVNDNPVANADSATVAEDSATNLAVLTNDTLGPDAGETLVVTAVTQGAHGIVAATPTGVSYAPAANYVGPDSFTYTMSDGNGGSATTTVNVTVALVNDAPVSRHDVFTAVVNQTTAVGGKGVLANDDDIADDANGIYPLSVTAPTTIVVSDPAKGSVAVNADGSFTYTSTSSALGSNTFSYRAVDRDGGLSNVALVTINLVLVTVSDPAEAGDTVATGEVVSSSDPLQSAVTTPIPASVSITQGVISADAMDPPAGFAFLNRQVNISITDGNGAPLTATPEAPFVFSFLLHKSLVPAAGPGETFGDAVAALTVFRNGRAVPDCLGQRSIADVTNGNPCLSERLVSTDSVEFTVLTTAASLWHIGADGTAIDPAQNDGPFVTTVETRLLVPSPGVLGNDFGDRDMTASLSATPAPEGGTVALSESGGFTFTPDPGFCGPASFGYRAQSGSDVSNVAVVSLVVNCNPHAEADIVPPVLEDSGPTIVDVLSNDTDSDAEPAATLSFDVATNPANGTATKIDNNSVRYQPHANFSGSDSFTYTVKDSRGGVATGTVNVTVTPVNDAPSFTKGVDQTVSEDSGTSGAHSVTGWASNLSAGAGEAQSLSFAVSNNNNALFASQPTITSDGTLRYTLAANAHGSALVTSSIRDSGGTANGGDDASDPQTFVITVTPVADAPLMTVVGGSFVYDGAAHAATATIAGAGGETIPGGVAFTYSPGGSQAPVNAGTYGVVATFTSSDANYTNSTGTGTVTITKAGQTITFGALANKASGDAPFTVSATASSGLAVSFSIVSGPASVAGNTITLTGGGTVVVRASQAGNGNYNAAPAVDRSFTVTAPAPTTPSTTSIPTASLTTAAYGTNLTFTSTVTGTGGTPTGLVEFFDGTVSLGTAPLNAAGTASKTTNAVAAGTRSITAKYLGDSKFAGSTSGVRTVTVTGTTTMTTTFTASPLQQQYSDRMTFGATVSPATVGGRPSAKFARFKLGTEVLGTANLILNTASGKLEATLSAPLLETTAGALRPGSKLATVEFVDVDPSVTIANKSGSVGVKAEDALTAYTGPAEVLTTTGAATIRLESAVTEVADGNLGDVRTATVTFVNRTTGATIGTGTLDTARSTATTAYFYFNYAVNIGANASQSFSIGTMVSGYYLRNAATENGTTIVKKP